MNKSPAQVAYETFSSSFGIDVLQPVGRGAAVRGPVPWDRLDPGERVRWELTFLAGLRVAAQTSLILPGWACPKCRLFNGEMKGRLEKCRSCSTSRPLHALDWRAILGARP